MKKLFRLLGILLVSLMFVGVVSAEDVFPYYDITFTSTSTGPEYIKIKAGSTIDLSIRDGDTPWAGTMQIQRSLLNEDVWYTIEPSYSGNIERASVRLGSAGFKYRAKPSDLTAGEVRVIMRSN